MDNSHIARISVTPTIARQTPKNEFGHVLSNTLSCVMNAGTAIMGSLPGMPIISSAVSAVSSLATAHTASAASAAISVHGGGGSGGVPAVPGVGSTLGGGVSRSTAGSSNQPPEMDSMIKGMREEANRSLMMQMNMQTESREYNAVTNILKLRHDSAKAAINNIR